LLGSAREKRRHADPEFRRTTRKLPRASYLKYGQEKAPRISGLSVVKTRKGISDTRARYVEKVPQATQTGSNRERNMIEGKGVRPHPLSVSNAWIHGRPTRPPKVK
jgi:hypothetical protein